MSTLSHVQALPIVRAAWKKVHGREPSENEAVLSMAVAYLETGYGRAGQHGKLAADGKYNWANLEKARKEGEECPPGWAPGKDKVEHLGGAEVHAVCFRVFPTDEDAAAALISNLTKRHWPVLGAMAMGSGTAVAKAMKASPAYYAAPEASYASGLERVAGEIRRSLGLTSPATPVGPVPGHGTLPGLQPLTAQAMPVVAALAGGAATLLLLRVAFAALEFRESRR